MKPRLGKTVYCICENCISKEKVGFAGKDSFIVEDFNDCRLFESLEYFYEDYDKTWCTSLQKAKKILLQSIKKDNPDPKVKVVQLNHSYWETC